MMAIVYFLLSECMYKYTYINYHVLTYIHKYMYGVNPLSYLQIYIYTYITILLVLTASLSLCLCSSSPARQRLTPSGFILVQPSSSSRAFPSGCAAVVLPVGGFLTADLFSCSHPAAAAPLSLSSGLCRGRTDYLPAAIQQ
jgi:hypothetical protein